MICFLQIKSGTTAALIDLIDGHIAPVDVEIGITRTDGRAKFAGPFQSFLDKLDICHERTPPTRRNTTELLSGTWACFATRLSHSYEA